MGRFPARLGFASDDYDSHTSRPIFGRVVHHTQHVFANISRDQRIAVADPDEPKGGFATPSPAQCRSGEAEVMSERTRITRALQRTRNELLTPLVIQLCLIFMAVCLGKGHHFLQPLAKMHQAWRCEKRMSDNLRSLETPSPSLRVRYPNRRDGQGITSYPPFPEDVPTHPLLVVDYDLILKNDTEEIDKLWKAATTLGFWYLKNHGVDSEADQMFEMGAETMKLPLEEKMKFEQGDSGLSFGYKAAGANAVDESGLKDTVEFINVSKDDALAFPEVVHRTYPSTVVARMKSTIQPFVRKSNDINTKLINVFNAKLGLPEGALAQLHLLLDPSCSEARCIKNPPAKEMSPERQALGAHTDFGSLSFLHNRLGGLQVYPPGADKWYYIKPIPGHAICNVGDALSVFSGGILRSNVHRVVTPPKDQAAYERWSLVFFSRPANGVELRALTEKSEAIASAVAKSPDLSIFETGQTAQEWFARRIKNQRIKNRTGPETWKASRGTEHNELRPTVTASA